MKNNNPKKILVVRSDRFGEFLLSLYSIKLLKENFPDSEISILAQEENIKLIKGIDFIDKFFNYEKFYENRLGFLKLASFFKKHKFDCIVFLNPKKIFHIASFLAGVKTRVGYNRKFGFCLNKTIEDAKDLARKHETEYNNDLVSLLCDKVFLPNIQFPADSIETIAHIEKEGFCKKEKYIIIHPFSSNNKKTWDKQRWFELFKDLNKRFNEKIVIIGSLDNKQKFDDIDKEFPNIINLIGATSLRNLATLFKHCAKILITVDSGPMHLASFFEVPIVSIFGVSSPKRWGPLSSKNVVIYNNSIEEINISEIVDATAKIIKKAG